MGLDVKKNPFLYSVGTQLAYKIAKDTIKIFIMLGVQQNLILQNNRRLQIRQQYVKGI